MVTSIPPIAVVVLAGGLSRRMGGRDKALIDLAGRPMIAHIIARLGPQASQIAINANDDPARFASLGIPVLADPVAGHPGPLAGVLAAMRWAERSLIGVTDVVTVPADTPFLPRDLIARLVAAAHPGQIVLAASHGTLHQVVGLWPLALAGALEQYLSSGRSKVLDFVEQQGFLRVEFPDQTIGGRSVDPFFNTNTPEDLAVAESLLTLPDGAG